MNKIEERFEDKKKFVNLKLLLKKIQYLILLFSFLTTILIAIQLVFRVENLLTTVLVLLSLSLIFLTLFFKGFKYSSYLFLTLFILAIILGPEIILTILGKGELGWYDEIDGQIGYALTEGSSLKGFNHFWAGGTPLNHGFNVGNLSSYFSKGIDIPIQIKILFIRILSWFLALLIPLKLINNYKEVKTKDKIFSSKYFIIHKFLFILGIVNIDMLHGWVFTRGFLGPLIIIFITYKRSLHNKSNFYLFLFSLFAYLLGSYFVPSFVNGALEGLVAISLICLVDLVQFKYFPKDKLFNLATIFLILIFGYVIAEQFFLLRQINLEEFSRLIRINYPSLIEILKNVIRTPSTNVVVGCMCFMGITNKNLRLRSFAYIVIPLSITFIISILSLNINYEFYLDNYFKSLRPDIFISSLHFLFIDLILINIHNNKKINLINRQKNTLLQFNKI